MIKYYRFIGETTNRIVEAASITLEAYRAGRIEQEAQLTDRLLSAIELSMDGFEVSSIKWTAKTLTDRGRGSQESKYGADFMGVLNIDIPGYRIEKGFLVQAKRISNDGLISKSEFERLQKQCRQMLRLTPSSFVVVYLPDNIFFTSAISIVASDYTKYFLENFYYHDIRAFFWEHFKSFYGDPAINAPTVDIIEEIAEKYDARSLLYLGAQERRNKE